ncbi:amino acid permease [Streptomyces sp. NY05-11A]|uniref:amino acid permease n=1 Tax=Streptomyces soliscabiei TaxID=588897 RepID=UPI0029AB55F4|nr:amino acid permease [Streptomyces sp. NY05-11A]MDX2675049.1 amino acid permease [Streptomyces sp. NY05-11A]
MAGRSPKQPADEPASAVSTPPQPSTGERAPRRRSVDQADAGYAKTLRPRHIQMIAIGGSIGTGLFLGAGGRLAQGGPALALVYAVCGVFTWFMMRALGEMAVYRPSSGAFVSYAREFMGEKGAYVTGWLFFIDWCASVMAETTAIALYLHYWDAFKPVPQWILALISLALVVAVNMLSVKIFGETEFWFAIIKIVAIVGFMVVASAVVLLQFQVDGHSPGPALITDNGGLFPRGWLPAITLALGVVFAFGGTEMVGVAAGESDKAEEVIPKAVNSTFWRIAIFYVGAVLLFTLVLPWTAYSKSESPFVTFFSALGLPGIGSAMNLVVITAAMSSMNSGLYATGRTLRSMAIAGSGPRIAARLNRNQVPFAGVLITAGLGVIGVVINYVRPSQAFDIVMNLAGIGIAGTWMSIMVSHWLFVRRARQGLLTRPAFRLPGAPWVNLLTVLFLTMVIVGMWFADDIGKPTILLFLGICVLMVIGWYRIRNRIATTTLPPAQGPHSAPGTDAAPDGTEPA